MTTMPDWCAPSTRRLQLLPLAAHCEPRIQESVWGTLHAWQLPCAWFGCRMPELPDWLLHPDWVTVYHSRWMQLLQWHVCNAIPCHGLRLSLSPFSFRRWQAHTVDSGCFYCFCSFHTRQVHLSLWTSQQIQFQLQLHAYTYVPHIANAFWITWHISVSVSASVSVSVSFQLSSVELSWVKYSLAGRVLLWVFVKRILQWFSNWPKYLCYYCLLPANSNPNHV